jgi:hypothetical protein
MKKLIYVCDGCGKEIQGDIFKIIPEAIDRKTEDYTGSPIYAGQMDKHYCAECTVAFISSLNMLPAAVPEEEPQKEEDPEEPKDEEEPETLLEEPPGKKNKMIKTRFLPPVREYSKPKQSVDKDKLYAEYLTRKGEKYLMKALGEKYGCSDERARQIVREMEKRGEDNEEVTV